MATEVTVKEYQTSLPSLWELPSQLTECERRNFFRLENVRRPDGVTVTRKVFIPPSQADAQELEIIKSALENRLAKANATTIIAVLARLANHHKSDRTAAEWTALYEDYASDLMEFSDAHVIQAINEHRKTSKWFPKVAELRERCLELRDLDQCRLRRVHLSLTGKESA